jgi:hypothetical protein
MPDEVPFTSQCVLIYIRDFRLTLQSNKPPKQEATKMMGLSKVASYFHG